MSVKSSTGVLATFSRELAKLSQEFAKFSREFADFSRELANFGREFALKRYTTCVALLLSRYTVSRSSPYVFAMSHENRAWPPKVSPKRPCRTRLGGGVSHLNFAPLNCSPNIDHKIVSRYLHGRPLKKTYVIGVPKSEFFECAYGPLSSPSGPVHSPTTSPHLTSPFIPPFLTPRKA